MAEVIAAEERHGSNPRGNPRGNPMKARDLARLNGRLALELKARRDDGALASDEDLTDAILLENGAGDIDIAPLNARLQRRAAARRRANPSPKLGHGST